MTHPMPLVRGVDNPVVVRMRIRRRGATDWIPGQADLFDPQLMGKVERGTASARPSITRVVPGTFPESADKTDKLAYGTGIGTPWKPGRRGTFVFAVRPSVARGQVKLHARLWGRESENGPRKKATLSASVPLAPRPENHITRQHLATAAASRATLFDSFGSIMLAESLGTDARQALRNTITAIGMSGVTLLADKVLDTLFSIKEIAGYLWEAAMKYFNSPFEFLLDGSVPGNLLSIDDVDVAEFGPPFYTEILENAKMFSVSFMERADRYDSKAREVANRGTILFHALAAAASDEAEAWRNGNERLARQYLANQLFMLDGTDKDAQNGFNGAIDDRFQAHVDVVDSPPFRYDQDVFDTQFYSDLVQKTGAMWALSSKVASDPKYGKAAASSMWTMHRFTRGEAGRVNHLLRYVDENGLGGTNPTPTPTPTPPPRESPERGAEFVDDFEDESFSDYIVIAGDRTDWTIESGIDGKSLYAERSEGKAFAVLEPSTYQWRGDRTVSVRFQADTSNWKRNAWVLTGDGEKRWFARVGVQGDAVNLVRGDGNLNTNTVEKVSTNVRDGTAHRLTLDLRGQQIRVLLDDTELVTYRHDDSVGAGTVGVGTTGGVSHATWFDDLQVIPR